MPKPLLVTMGEPAGIGPDICLDLVNCDYPVVVLGDKAVLKARALMLRREIEIVDEHIAAKSHQLSVRHISCEAAVVPGCLNVDNALMVIEMLRQGAELVMKGDYAALVTGPIHKKHLQQVIPGFSGHTEFFQELSNVSQVVMMLASAEMKVALLTTHLPLIKVASAITQDKIKAVVNILDQVLKSEFGIPSPKIAVAGLNPHAGEQGALGQEEIEIIIPAIESLKKEGKNLIGPVSADTMFCDKTNDAFLAMYHDQGLPVIKYASFGRAANITLGLPFIRTSVDHGTALDIAGLGKASSSSLMAAIEVAKQMVASKI
jgi:4-hydroxythreonine-4-phosphate dehydrogenase